MSERKKGEEEAIIILESIGFPIDKKYMDDNSKPSMPDLRYNDGRYIEVTHTKHNNYAFTNPSKYDQFLPGESGDEWIKRHYDKEKDCEKAFDRIENLDYERDGQGNFTEKANELYHKDCKLLQSHLGYNLTENDIKKQFSEFKCDRPIFSFSADNILNEIENDKGRKRYRVETDLFIFAAEQEFNAMKKLVSERSWNGVACEFLNRIISSKFNVIFVCSWNIENQEYNILNPRIIRFEKGNNELKWKWFN